MESKYKEKEKTIRKIPPKINKEQAFPNIKSDFLKKNKKNNKYKREIQKIKK